MTLRKILFWCHLAAGVTVGAVILIMSVTGVLLTYERQISWWADTRHYSIQPPHPDAPRRSIESLIVGVHEAEPRGTFTTMTVRADPLAPVAFAAADRTVYVNPYTGDVMGNGSPGTRRFFRAVTDWHRTLAFTGDRRPLGRAITGACNLAFLFIVSSGLWLWWPRAWTRRHVRSVTTFNARLRGRARDFNWHNVVGFWSAIPLIVIVLGASVISYPWATNMVYRLVGETPPTPQRPRQPAAGAARPDRAASAGADNPRPLVDGIDALWTRAERQVVGWRIISVRLSTAPDAPVVFTIDQGTGGQPQKRGTLTLARSTADVLRWEPYSTLSPGRRLRVWLRFAHTGEVYGLAGQAVAGLASLGGATLVVTGLMLAGRRLLAWRARAKTPSELQSRRVPTRGWNGRRWILSDRRYLLEAAQVVRVDREGGGQHLDRDLAPEARVARAIDLAHAPAPSGATIS
jgi:uncharacterized iron-regulated membrane protein